MQFTLEIEHRGEASVLTTCKWGLIFSIRKIRSKSYRFHELYQKLVGSNSIFTGKKFNFIHNEKKNKIRWELEPHAWNLFGFTNKASVKSKIDL